MFEICSTLLKETDAFAVENVKAGRGGPFGAILAVCDPESLKYVRVGDIHANAVLSTGMASAHAEDQVLQPKNVSALVHELRIWRGEGFTPAVILASSGQSCQSCHAKEEIVARHLIRENLIEPENFIVAYGATFDDTSAIAKFKDLPYVLDLVRFDQNPLSGISMVKHGVADIGAIPLPVADCFRKALQQIAVLARGDKIVAIGKDLRVVNDVISTAEVTAIRDACRKQKASGLEQPWVLGKKNSRDSDSATIATLYTTSPQLGPLMRGEAQWAAVNNIITVTGVDDRGVTREDKDVTNAYLLNALARGYNHPDSVLRVFHDETFPNQAQREWAKKLKKEGNAILYNGVDSDPDLKRYADYAHKAFKGIPLAR